MGRCAWGGCGSDGGFGRTCHGRPRAAAQLVVHRDGCLVLCRPEDVPDDDKLLGSDLLVQEGLDAWRPFTAPLRDAGLPRVTFRAPLIAKLEDAGFFTLLDVRP